jgi:serine/threonine-protein kinase
MTALEAIPVLPSRLVPVRQLGQGSTAEVLLVEWIDTHGQRRRGALKQPLLHHGYDAEGIARLLRNEAELAARLVHPQVPRLLAYRPTPPALLFEYVDAGGLDAVIAAGPLPFTSAVFIIDALLDVVSAVHAMPGHVVHRDLDSHNVLIARSGDVVLIDFGTAIDDDRARWTAAGGLRGSLAALSPEALRGETIDARADLFAIGVLACRLWAGRDPFASKSPRERLHRIASGAPALTGIDAVLVDWCTRALAAAPAHRFHSAADMRAALSAVASSSAADRLVLSARVSTIVPAHENDPTTSTQTR